MSFRGTLIQLPTRWTVFFPADFNTFFATTTIWRIAVTVNVLKSAGKKIGGEVEQELTKWIAAGNDLNGCALRLSMALNNAGYTIPAMGKQTLKVGCSKSVYTSDAKSARIQLIKLLIFNTLYRKISF